jgi:hypothetical protein
VGVDVGIGEVEPRGEIRCADGSLLVDVEVEVVNRW